MPSIDQEAWDFYKSMDSNREIALDALKHAQDETKRADKAEAMLMKLCYGVWEAVDILERVGNPAKLTVEAHQKLVSVMDEINNATKKEVALPD